MKTKVHYIIILLLVLLIAGLSLANMETVKVSYLFGHFQLPLIILILVSVLLGAIVASLLGMSKHFSLKGELKQAKKELKEQKQQLEEKVAQVQTELNQQKQLLAEQAKQESQTIEEETPLS